MRQSVLSLYHHHYDLHEEESIWWAGFCHCIILDWCNLNSPFTGHIMVMREWRLRVSCSYPPTIAHLIDMGTSIHRGSRVVETSCEYGPLYNTLPWTSFNPNQSEPLITLPSTIKLNISSCIVELVGLDAQKLTLFLLETFLLYVLRVQTHFVSIPS